MKGSIFILVIVQALCASRAQAAYDPTRFLRDPDIHILVDSNAQPRLAPNGNGYLAEGPNGASYMLNLSSDAPDLAGVSLFREALGLPNLASYPVLIQVGANGVPITARLQSGVRFEELARGTLRLRMRAWNFGYRQLPALLIAEYVGHAIVSAITGTSTSKILFTGQHFYVAELLRSEAIPAGASPAEANKATEWMFAALPESMRLQIQEFQPQDFDIFAGILNRLLARLKTLKPDEVRLLLGASFGSMQELMGRIHAVEPALQSALRKLNAPEGKIGAQYAAHPLAPHVKIPSRNPERLLKLSNADVRKLPVQVLWALYFNPTSPQVRKLVGRWARQGESAQADTGLPNLIQAARLNVEEVYAVSHHMQPNLDHPSLDKVPTLADPERNGRILIVTSSARQDQESRAILNMADRAGAKYFQLPDQRRDAFGHEGDHVMAQEIQNYVNIGGNVIDTIVLVEMKERAPNIEQWLETRGYRVVAVDHHQNTEIDRSHPRSSLEQVAEILGHTLSPSEYTIALIDRLGTRGARLLGVSDPTLRAHYRTLPASLEGVQPIATSRGHLYITDRPHRDLGPNVNYVNLIEYPAYANVLMIGPGLIRFSGHPDTVRELREYFGHERSELARSTYSNGDYGIYWAMRVSKLDFEDVVGRITWYLEHGYKFLEHTSTASSASKGLSPQKTKVSDRTRNRPKEKQKKKLTPPKHHPTVQQLLNTMMHSMACQEAIKEIVESKRP